MAVCGWCKAKDLVNNRGVDGLETHYRPNSRQWCEGPATSDYSSKVVQKKNKQSKEAA